MLEQLKIIFNNNDLIQKFKIIFNNKDLIQKFKIEKLERLEKILEE